MQINSVLEYNVYVLSDYYPFSFTSPFSDLHFNPHISLTVHPPNLSLYGLSLSPWLCLLALPVFISPLYFYPEVKEG